MKKLKFLGILLIGLLLLASPANATGYRMIMMAGGVEAADGGNDAYTKLLMHMEGTDDAQVFTDSSVGNLVEVDAGTGFSDAFGVFDGTGDYLSLADHGDWDFDTDPFTIELWVRFDTLTDFHWLVTQYNAGAGDPTTDYWALYWHTADGIKFISKASDSITINISQGAITGWSTGVWYHVAVVRNGNDFNIYRDGVSVASGTDASAVDYINYPLYIGYGPPSADWELSGYMDELRISNTARYTSGFTPSTENFTSDANTKLLLHMDLPNADPESFVDSGNTGHSVTQNGNAYQKARNLGIIGTSCGYFDGTGDYLSMAANADWDLTGDFTIEFHIKGGAHDDDTPLFATGNRNAQDEWYVSCQTTGFRFFWDDGTQRLLNWGNVNIEDNVWHHVAIVRSGSTWYGFVDGVLASTSSTTGSPADQSIASTGALQVFGSGSYTGFAAGDYKGYVDDLRIVKGTAVYTANFNPPTTALTDITNTKLLLHFDGGEGSVTFTDSNTEVSAKTVTANGNAIQVIGHGADATADVKTENTQYKFGTTSAYFDGTGDYITLSDSIDWDIVANTDDATVDFWVKHDDHAGTEVYVVQFEDANNNWSVYHVDGTGLYFNVQSASASIVQINSGSEITDTDWHHIAVVKNATVYNLYLDGTSVGNTTDASVDTFAGDLIVGSDGTNDFAGYIDELRISKGIARWTANFTPPNAAYYE